MIKKSLRDFRWNFIDCQNKAGFAKASKGLVSEFRSFMFDENIDNSDNGDFIELSISKKTVMFRWVFDGVEKFLYLNKEGENSVEDIQTMKFIPTEKITLYDTSIVGELVKFISQLFTGTNWGTLKTK